VDDKTQSSLIHLHFFKSLPSLGCNAHNLRCNSRRLTGPEELKMEMEDLCQEADMDRRLITGI
jgi:hypothetical protein